MTGHHCPVCDFGEDEEKSLQSVRSHVTSSGDPDHDWEELQDVVDVDVVAVHLDADSRGKVLGHRFDPIAVRRSSVRQQWPDLKHDLPRFLFGERVRCDEADLVLVVGLVRLALGGDPTGPVARAVVGEESVGAGDVLDEHVALRVHHVVPLLDDGAVGAHPVALAGARLRCALLRALVAAASGERLEIGVAIVALVLLWDALE